jgi:fluoride ion exporter CrcB/FEX
MLVILAFLGGGIIGALARYVLSEHDPFEQLGHDGEL